VDAGRGRKKNFTHEMTNDSSRKHWSPVWRHLEKQLALQPALTVTVTRKPRALTVSDRSRRPRRIQSHVHPPIKSNGPYAIMIGRGAKQEQEEKGVTVTVIIITTS
jgi:hypothetical protein